MRYRPFGISGKAVSALSLLLRDHGRAQPPGAWRSLAVSAMECGINAFEVEAGVDTLAVGFRQAMESVERRLLFVAWRICGDGRSPTDARAVEDAVRHGLAQTGAGYFDLLTLDEPAYATLTSEGARMLDNARSAGLALQIGISGSGALVDQAVASGEFDALSSPFNLTSGWNIRRRIREAAQRNMSITGYDAFPPELCRPPAQAPAKTSLFRRSGPSAATVGAYGFLHETRNWAADELCLAYALTEPSLACIQIEAHRPEVIERLAGVPDRELPTGLAAQIEMARIDTPPDARRA
jgi:aryl-alcohol dehydrogenase-like predicted oxidoreductase